MFSCVPAELRSSEGGLQAFFKGISAYVFAALPVTSSAILLYRLSSGLSMPCVLSKCGAAYKPLPAAFTNFGIPRGCIAPLTIQLGARGKKLSESRWVSSVKGKSADWWRLLARLYSSWFNWLSWNSFNCRCRSAVAFGCKERIKNKAKDVLATLL